MQPGKTYGSHRKTLAFFSHIMDNKQNVENKAHRTSIQSFYAGQSVFITGGTGFLGKVLIEKLLRSCSDIEAIYLLIRPKKDKSPETRLDEMFNSIIYARVREEVPNFRKKIIPIMGDLKIDGLELSENEKDILTRKVSIIFHLAANTRFEEKIKVSTIINVNSIDTILNFVKHMPNLKSFIYVSTAYSNYHIKYIDERFYTYPIKHKDLITLTHTLSENEMEKKVTEIASQWPNTYTFTKAIAEALLREEGRGLPIGILRPGIITSSANEPLIGWADNIYGQIGGTIFLAHGLQRFQLGDGNLKMCTVPVDFTANALIASAWDVFNQWKKGETALIYNFVSIDTNPPTWNEYINKMTSLSKLYPVKKILWIPFYKFIPQKILYKICIWFGHLLPAILMDAVYICMYHRPRMWKLYTKIHKYSDAVACFALKHLDFSLHNVEAMWNRLSEKDQQLFKFQMKEFDWTEYFVNLYKGIRLYLLKEDDSTLEISRIRYKRLYSIHRTFKTVLIFAILWIVWCIFVKIFFMLTLRTMDNKYVKNEAYRTSIQNFYAGQSVFITGGTGFLGKALIEKLLRSCSDITTIYLLIRPKENQSSERRLDEMFKNVLYDRVKEEVPNFRKKILPIIGDLEIDGLGLSENDKNILIREVSIIFHVAANVRFEEKFKVSTIINVNSTDTILNIAKRMPNLKSFIHVSTAYSNCHLKYIDECFYTYPINHKDLITFSRTLSENEMEKKVTKIASQWPNTYTFTKAIAEALLRDECGNLPIGIYRPAIITNSANEPLAGWIDNLYGPSGIIIPAAAGLQRFQLANGNLVTNIVPVDFTANALIASAWDVFNQWKKGETTLIYNFVSMDSPTWYEYVNKMFSLNKLYPFKEAIWIPFFKLIPHKVLYKICIWLGHLLPAFLMDAVNICMNRRPRLWKLYRKIHKYSNAIAPFMLNRFNFSDHNVDAMWNRLSDKDQQLFEFHMKGFDWMKYLVDHYKGIRLYLVKEDDSTLEISRSRYKRFYLIHQTFKIVLTFVILWIIWSIFAKILI
ncbi:PREDICTED: uncharacterized protein LOC105457578 [Wasmannia auropunctata]|uniref:uncharacterized protein LOC105457578 n=1 Tax=Wasmannia auropunctata TaxID=64793 RepID=UPI0005ED4743|nr:PREDICTED: uncharacterized protein LOC105457578 [Wasmannia auropunctata]